MTGRDKKSSGSSSKAPPPARQSTFFINGQGIDREVITTDICRYLGNDALVKPGTHQDPKTGQLQEGFYITAYRAPTSAQLQDLRNDSQKWQEERRRTTSSRGAPPTGGYDQSATRQEAMHGNIQGDFRGNTTPSTYRDNMSTQPAYGGSMTAPNPPPSSGYGGYPGPSMAPPPPPGNFNAWNNPSTPHYGQENYTLHSPPPLASVNYAPQDDRRGDRIDPSAQPRQMMPPTNQYSQGQGQVPTQPQPNYGSGRGGPPFYATSSTQPMTQQPTQFGSSMQDAFYGRAPATAQDVYEEDYREDEEMQYDAAPAQAPVPNPSSSRQRDGREREQHESKRHHSSRR